MLVPDLRLAKDKMLTNFPAIPSPAPRSVIMFRKHLILCAALLALFCLAGMPGQVHAQRGHGGSRGGFHGGFGSQSRRGNIGFDRRFGGFGFGGFGGFGAGFGGFNGGVVGFSPAFGGFAPGYVSPFFDPRFSGFVPGYGAPFFDPRFGGFNRDFDRRSGASRRGRF